MGCKNVGDTLFSPDYITKYKNKDIHWYLVLYPKGEPDSKKYLGLYLRCRTAIRAVATFIIVNNEGKVMESFITDENLFSEDSSWGYNKFILQSAVQNPSNGILDNDKLTIVCKVKYKNYEIKSSIMSRRTAKKRKLDDEIEDDVSALPRLEDDYEALLNDGKFSDVSLVSEGKAINVHKHILARRSAVFAAMFENEMKEKQENTVEIVDIKYDVVMEMLRFVYAGKINDIGTLAPELAAAAEKYALNGLKIMCEKTMIKNVSPSSVIEYLETAGRLRFDTLKKKTIEFVVENAADISDKLEFNLLPPDIICEVFRCLAKRNQ